MFFGEWSFRDRNRKVALLVNGCVSLGFSICGWKGQDQVSPPLFRLAFTESANREWSLDSIPKRTGFSSRSVLVHILVHGPVVYSSLGRSKLQAGPPLICPISQGSESAVILWM